MRGLAALGAPQYGASRPLACAVLERRLWDRHAAGGSGLRPTWLPARRSRRFEAALAGLRPLDAVEHDLAPAAKNRGRRVGLRRMSGASAGRSPARPGVCTICGRPLVHHRAHARACSASCRAEASRLKAIIDGTYSGRYRSVAERLSKVRHASPLGIALRRPRDAPGSAHNTARGHQKEA